MEENIFHAPKFIILLKKKKLKLPDEDLWN